MKILVCGKGGCGKSAITALLAKEIARKGRNVLVADNDESNFGLHNSLGLNLPKELVDYFGGRDKIFDKIDDNEGALRLENVSSEYISKKDRIRFLSMGKIGGYGEGCACPINALSSEFYDDLKLENGEILLVDAEAGIEHFGRGVEEGIDLVLMVVDPTQESLKLARKVSDFGKELNLKVLFVLNKVSESEKKFLKESLPEQRILGSVSKEDSIAKASLKGKELNLEISEIREIVEKIDEMSEQIITDRN